jgi:hypothetical protein
MLDALKNKKIFCFPVFKELILTLQKMIDKTKLKNLRLFKTLIQLTT